MNDIADYKRKKVNRLAGDRYSGFRKHHRGFLAGVLDVIENDYPDRYAIILDSSVPAETLFSNDEWLDILTKSRKSYTNHINGIRKTIRNKASSGSGNGCGLV